jgi:hypothetical protein
MAKGIRSKVKKRYRTAKRELVEAHVIKKRVADKNAKINLIAEGRIAELVPKPKKNGFLYPDHPDAEFPQAKIIKPLDFRSEALPGAAFAQRGIRRKFTKEEMALNPRIVVPIEGKGKYGAITGKYIADYEAEGGAAAHAQGDDDAMQNIEFFEDTDAVQVEHDELRDVAKKARAQGRTSTTGRSCPCGRRSRPAARRRTARPRARSKRPAARRRAARSERLGLSF